MAMTARKKTERLRCSPFGEPCNPCRFFLSTLLLKQESNGSKEQDGAENIFDRDKPFEQGDTRGDKQTAHQDGADDAPRQCPLLIGHV